MLHLAQVKKNSTSGEMELQLLAHQQAESSWELGNLESLPLETDTCWQEGVLVLVECNSNQQIIKIDEAKDWILDILKRYQNLTQNAIAPEFVLEEQNKVEQWRQEITAQSLELNRRSLEIETRREQLQELEQLLKQDQEELAKQKEELEKLADSLKNEQGKGNR
jgi:hypothetical protein